MDLLDYIFNPKISIMRKNYTKYALSCIASFVFACSANAQAWDGTAESWTQGDGTETSPYLIENGKHLAFLSQQVNEGKTFENQYFKLANDLDMGKSEGKTFTIIGSFNTYLNTETMQKVDNSKYFKGVIDGGYHKIDNLNIEYVNEDLGGTGLFACITDQTIIKNLIIGSNSTVSGGMTCGAFVGQMNGGLITNCSNEAVVTATNFYTGGIVGVLEKGEVTMCCNKGDITGTTELGGIIGQGAETGVVSYCYNVGVIKANGFGGAGIGGALYGNAVIKNCYNVGNISGESSPWLGTPHAIVSDVAQQGSVTDCYYVKEMSLVDDEYGTAKTQEELSSQATIDALNSGNPEAPFVADTEQVNNGMPILKWQLNSVTAIENVVSNDKNRIAVQGNQVSSADLIHVYDTSGRLIGTGKKLTLDKGMYIVKGSKDTQKVLIK